MVIFSAIYFFIAEGSFLKERADITFGVTFSTLMARQLDLVPREVFDAIVDDIGVRKIRLPVYWSDIEKKKGEFEFTEYDFMIKKSEDARVKLILVVGRKLPRWPECHIPEWSRSLSEEEFEKAVQNQMRVVVERYRNSPALEIWQIENEPFHVFGASCAQEKISAQSVDAEISLIRSLDSHPIMMTDAGKAGFWFTSLRRADIIGVTMYYQVWNPMRKVVWSTFGPGLFWLKRKILEPFFPNKEFMVAELQGEPYGPELLPFYDLKLQKELMNVDRFRETIRRARKAGFQENYFWGVEWWYWLKEKHNDPSMWNKAKNVLHNI